MNQGNVSQELRQRAVSQVFDNLFRDKQFDATVQESTLDRESREGIAAGNQWIEMQKMLSKGILTPKDLAEIQYKEKLGQYTDAQRQQIENNMGNRVPITLDDGVQVNAAPNEAITWYGKQLEQRGRATKMEQELVQSNLKAFADQIRTKLIAYGGNEGESIQAMWNKNGTGYLRMQNIANMTPDDALKAGVARDYDSAQAAITKAQQDKYFVDTQIHHSKYPTGKIPIISIPSGERQKLQPGRPHVFVDSDDGVLFVMPEGDSVKILNIIPPGLSLERTEAEALRLMDVYGL